MIPELEPRCGSWIVVCRATGVPVMETFSKAVAEAVNQDAYQVLTALQWLAGLNIENRHLISR